jgi:hypothetical protein
MPSGLSDDPTAELRRSRVDEEKIDSEAHAAPSAPATGTGPSIAHRLAFAALVSAFSLGGEGCLRNAFVNAHLIDIGHLLIAFVFLLAPFIGAIVASAVLRAGRFFRPVFVGSMALVGLLTGMWLGEVNDMAPMLRDFLPHLYGASAGALVGTLWTRAEPRPTPLMGVVVLLVIILIAVLLVPARLRA